MGVMTDMLEQADEETAKLRARIAELEAERDALQERLDGEAPCAVCAGSGKLETPVLTVEACGVCSGTGREAEEVMGLRRECHRLRADLARARSPEAVCGAFEGLMGSLSLRSVVRDKFAAEPEKRVMCVKYIDHGVHCVFHTTLAEAYAKLKEPRGDR